MLAAVGKGFEQTFKFDDVSLTEKTKGGKKVKKGDASVCVGPPVFIVLNNSGQS